MYALAQAAPRRHHRRRGASGATRPRGPPPRCGCGPCAGLWAPTVHLRMLGHAFPDRNHAAAGLAARVQLRMVRQAHSAPDRFAAETGQAGVLAACRLIPARGNQRRWRGGCTIAHARRPGDGLRPTRHRQADGRPPGGCVVQQRALWAARTACTAPRVRSLGVMRQQLQLVTQPSLPWCATPRKGRPGTRPRVPALKRRHVCSGRAPLRRARHARRPAGAGRLLKKGWAEAAAPAQPPARRWARRGRPARGVLLPAA
jgi:hypothetical protein